MHWSAPAVQRRRCMAESLRRMGCSSYTRASGIQPIFASFSAHRPVNSRSSVRVRVSQSSRRTSASVTMKPVPFRWQLRPSRARLSLNIRLMNQ